MIRLLRKSTFPILILGALCGCAKEAELSGSAGTDETPVTLFVLAPASRGVQSTDPNSLPGDDTIVDFRVMVFGYGGGKLVENEYVDDIWDGDDQKPTQIRINTGVYDFLFIANEKAGAAASDLNTCLSSYTNENTLSDALNEYFPQGDFDASRPIPMTALYRNVAVSGDNTLAFIEEGTTRRITDAVWAVDVHRLGIRLDLTLKTSQDALKSASKVTVRVPEKVYLINDRNGSSYSRPNHAAGGTTLDVEIPANLTNGSLASGTWTLPRIVLPENTFNPASTETLAMRVGVHFEGNIAPLYGTVAFDREADDFTAPRNYIYQLTGTLRDVIRFDGTVVAWGEFEQPEIDLTDPIRKLEPESNSYVVAPDSDPIAIPIGLLQDPRLISYIDPQILNGDLSELRADVLWSDTPGNGRGVGAGSAVRAVRFVNRGTFAKSYLLVTPGDVEGNSVVMLYKDRNVTGKYEQDYDLIGYSWHVWVSRDRDAILSGVEGIHGTSGETLYWMDRNLGAKYNRYVAADEAGVMGLQYQWGRKDPFPGVAGFADPNYITTSAVYGTQVPLLDEDWLDQASMSTAIQNPARIYGGNYKTDWCYNFHAIHFPWSDKTITDSRTEKSIFDPCPHGWKVPDYAAWTLTLGDPFWNFTTTCGAISNSFGGYYPFANSRWWGALFSKTTPGFYGFYWSSDGNMNGYGKDLVISPNVISNNATLEKANCLSIRCVKQ